MKNMKTRTFRTVFLGLMVILSNLSGSKVQAKDLDNKENPEKQAPKKNIQAEAIVETSKESFEINPTTSSDARITETPLQKGKATKVVPQRPSDLNQSDENKIDDAVRSTQAKNDQEKDVAIEKARLCHKNGGLAVNGQCILDLKYPPSGDADNNGLGFGLVLFPKQGSSNFGGFTLAYDRNFKDISRQLHITLTNYNIKEEFTFRGQEITIFEVSAVEYSASYRYLNNNRFFAGLGLRYQAIKLNYPGIDGTTFELNNAESTNTAAIIELGWQGRDGFYFSLGLRKPMIINQKTTFKEGDVVGNEAIRNQLADAYNSLKKSNTITFGFSWYLSP